MKHLKVLHFIASLIIFQLLSTNMALMEDFLSSPEKNVSIFASGLSEILEAIEDNSITILLPCYKKRSRVLNEFLKQVHSSLTTQMYLFSDPEIFYSYIDSSLKRSIQTISLIFAFPEYVIPEIRIKNLAHRLSLFLFYTEARSMNEIKLHELELREPLRAAIITHPKNQVYRIYYNQAVPDGSGGMTMVNWYDGNNFGLYKKPLLPRLEHVFKKLNWRTLLVPVIHTPPWLFVNYKYNLNETLDVNFMSESIAEYQNEYSEDSNFTNIEVIGGRDDALLKVIAEKMHFKVKYIDPPERTQGSVIGNLSSNLTFTGGIGMLQRREADIFLGDIPLSWERRQTVEFTFFTLADSGAFVTHAPRKLSEALVLIRPFLWEVWPILAVTVVISGVGLYFAIVIPYIYEDKYEFYQWRHYLSHRRQKNLVASRISTAKKLEAKTHFHYIDEITRNKRNKLGQTHLIIYKGIPRGILNNVSWFIVNLYLKQSVEIKYQKNRARFLAITMWLGATYVLGDMYSAQLTSQLARPAKETPINTLHKLEYVMRAKNYQLYVEKGSAAQTLLENATGTFARLYSLMQSQPTSEVASVKDGIMSILTYNSRAIIGGRETLYYNTKLFGPLNFQLSEKLYTRYSAIAVQNGCLYLDSLNIILMNLFEAGILDRMTNLEYEKMFGAKLQQDEEEIKKDNFISQRESQSTSHITSNQGSTKLEPISIRMLKGAFFVLLSGHFLALFLLILEKIEHKHRCMFYIRQKFKRNARKVRRAWNRLHIQDFIFRYF